MNVKATEHAERATTPLVVRSDLQRQLNGLFQLEGLNLMGLTPLFHVQLQIAEEAAPRRVKKEKRMKMPLTLFFPFVPLTGKIRSAPHTILLLVPFLSLPLFHPNCF